MKRLVGAFLTAVLVMVGGSAPACASNPLRILVMGDSITAPCGQTPPAGWCATFDALLTQAGVEHVIVSEAIAGTDCGYWSSRISAVLAADRPDLVLLNCGTNNWTSPGDPGDVLGQQWRSIVEAVHGYGARLGVAFIGYSDPEINAAAGRSWLVPSEGVVNDTLFRNMQYYTPYGWFTGVADFQQVPGNLDHLDSAPYGIHPNTRGAHEYGVIWYRALRADMGWPDIAPQPCGMWGHRPGVYGPPAYTPCP